MNFKLTFTERFNEALKDQGRTKKWLAARLEIAPNTIITKSKNDSWTPAERHYINHLLNIKEE